MVCVAHATNTENNYLISLENAKSLFCCYRMRVAFEYLSIAITIRLTLGNAENRVFRSLTPSAAGTQTQTITNNHHHQITSAFFFFLFVFQVEMNLACQSNIEQEPIKPLFR